MSNWSRIVNVFRRDRVTAEIDEELETHIREAIEHGRDPVEARRAFGSVLRLREYSNDVRLATWLDSLRSDVVFAFRQLRKNAAVTAAAIISLALAMGACTSAYRIIDALLLRPLPVAHPASLYVLTYPYTDGSGKIVAGEWFDYPQFRFLRAAVKNDAELMAISEPGRNGLTFTSQDQSERFMRQSVSGNVFQSFGLKPALGRLITPLDDQKPGASPVAVLSYDYWTRRFNRDPNVVGRKFVFGTELYQILGVSPHGFTGTDPGTVTDIFVPTMMNVEAIDNPHWNWFRIWVRPKPGVTPEALTQKLQVSEHLWRSQIVKDWSPTAPRELIDDYLRSSLNLVPASAGFSGLQKDYRQALAALAVLVGLLLLIACGNMANLMTARAAARSREMALRISIGAGKWRLMQLVMIESTLVAGIASLLGGAFAWWSAPFIVAHINPPSNPARLLLPADARVLAFAIALAIGVTLLFGLMPAVRASSIAPAAALHGEEVRSRRRVMTLLIGAQVALCFVVQFLAGLFVTTFHRLSEQPTGFVSNRVITLETATAGNKPSPYWDDVVQRLRHTPGVQSAAICGWALMSGGNWNNPVSVNGRSYGSEDSYFLPISSGWLETMRIPLLAGRDFRPGEPPMHIAIVNRLFARRYFAGQNPVGRAFEMTEGKKLVPYTVVGYAADARYLDMREPMRPTAYTPFGESEVLRGDWATFIVRTSVANPVSIADNLRRKISKAHPEFHVVNVVTQNELVEQHTIRERLLANLGLFFGAFALILSSVGLYGVLTYSVLQRRRDLSIRMALGASYREVIRRLTGEIAAMLVLGSLTGVIAGVISQHYVEKLLYQVNGTDPEVLAIAALTVVGVALLSALPPVIRAIHLQPAAVLRME